MTTQSNKDASQKLQDALERHKKQYPCTCEMYDGAAYCEGCRAYYAAYHRETE